MVNRREGLGRETGTEEGERSEKLSYNLLRPILFYVFWVDGGPFNV